MVTMSAREFNQSVAAAQRSAADEPVIVTRRGEPEFVLMGIEEYRRLTSRANPTRLSERLAPADGHDLVRYRIPPRYQHRSRRHDLVQLSFTRNFRPSKVAMPLLVNQRGRETPREGAQVPRSVRRKSGRSGGTHLSAAQS